MSTIYLSEKKEYRALDFSKFVAAFLVAAIHIPPFEEIAPVFSHEFQQVICRMAVPFFFVCTGYFIGEKITDKDRVKISFPYYKDVCMVESVISDTDH